MANSLQPKPGFDWGRVAWGRPDSPPSVLCSYCSGAISESMVPLILFADDGRAAQFCDDCMPALVGIPSGATGAGGDRMNERPVSIDRIVELTSIHRSAIGPNMWVIYDHPSDIPDKFVARLWFNLKATPELLAADTLDELRAMLPDGLYNIGRDPDDDPKILEVWL